MALNLIALSDPGRGFKAALSQGLVEHVLMRHGRLVLNQLRMTLILIGGSGFRIRPVRRARLTVIFFGVGRVEMGIVIRRILTAPARTSHLLQGAQPQFPQLARFVAQHRVDLVGRRRRIRSGDFDFPLGLALWGPLWLAPGFFLRLMVKACPSRKGPGDLGIVFLLTRNANTRGAVHHDRSAAGNDGPRRAARRHFDRIPGLERWSYSATSLLHDVGKLMGEELTPIEGLGGIALTPKDNVLAKRISLGLKCIGHLGRAIAVMDTNGREILAKLTLHLCAHMQRQPRPTTGRRLVGE